MSVSSWSSLFIVGQSTESIAMQGGQSGRRWFDFYTVFSAAPVICAFVSSTPSDSTTDRALPVVSVLIPFALGVALARCA